MNPIKPFDWFIAGSVILISGAALVDNSIITTGSTLMVIGTCCLLVAFVIAMSQRP